MSYAAKFFVFFAASSNMLKVWLKVRNQLRIYEHTYVAVFEVPEISNRFVQVQ